MTGEAARSHEAFGPDESIRTAVPEDNPRLVELERSCPQGSSLLIASEREDYFFRSTLYGNHHTLVAVDKEQDRLIGAMAGTIKEVLLSGRLMSATFFYDLRVHPDYRRTVLGRHMLRVWNLMNRWAASNGSSLLFGLVKSDNEHMLALQRKKKEYRFVGKMVVLGRPVYQGRRLRRVPREVDLSRENEWISAKVWKRYGGWQFFPTAFRGRYLSQPMADSGLFSCYCLEEGDSFASLGLFRVNRTMHTRVLRLPAHYRLLKPILDAARLVAPVPRIPRQGDAISYCHLFNHLAEGPRGVDLWEELLRFANNQALRERATLLMSAFDEHDPLLPLFARGALNRIDYLLSCLPFDPQVPEVLTPYYPDIRDMM
jgi:GNAT superfamily N-acetyltransferase